MAKFCRYCGNQIQDGGVCNCQGNASNVANNVNQASVNQSNLGNGANYNNQTNYNNQGNFNNGVNYNNQGSYNNQANYSNQNVYANTAGVNRHFNYQSRGVINNFTSYFKDMKSTVVKAVNEKNNGFVFLSAALLVISVVVNFLIMFKKLAKDTNIFMNSFINKIAKELFYYDYDYDIMKTLRVNVEVDNFEIILYGFLFGISLIAILLILAFLLSRINKSNWSNEGIFYAAIINTIPLSCVFLIGGILQLVFSFKFLLLLYIFYLITYVLTATLTYNMVTEGFKSVIDILVYSISMFIGIIILVYVYKTIFFNIIENFEINGKAIKYIISSAKGDVLDELENIKNRLLYLSDDIIEDILAVIFNLN